MKISELNGLTLPEKEDYIPIVDNSEKETKKATMTALLNLFYPVGSYYETSDAEFNPNTSWGGTWKLDNDGTVLVSQSLETGSVFDTQLSTVVGEEKHKLTTDEMPHHYHHDIELSGRHLTSWNQKTGSTTIYSLESLVSSDGKENQNYFTTGYAGGDKVHNNVQPSKVVNRWHREA